MIRLLPMLMLLVPAIALAGEWEPWTFEQGEPPPAAERTLGANSTLALPLQWGTVVFQQLVSPADGKPCRMTPTCSAYARQALRRNGALMGFVMTAERVMRDHSPPPGAKTIVTEDGWYAVDPVQNNDFWWRQR